MLSANEVGARTEHRQVCESGFFLLLLVDSCRFTVAAPRIATEPHTDSLAGSFDLWFIFGCDALGPRLRALRR